MRVRFATSLQYGASTTERQVEPLPGGVAAQLVGNLI